MTPSLPRGYLKRSLKKVSPCTYTLQFHAANNNNTITKNTTLSDNGLGKYPVLHEKTVQNTRPGNLKNINKWKRIMEIVLHAPDEIIHTDLIYFRLQCGKVYSNVVFKHCLINTILDNLTSWYLLYIVLTPYEWPLLQHYYPHFMIFLVINTENYSGKPRSIQCGSVPGEKIYYIRQINWNWWEAKYLKLPCDL